MRRRTRRERQADPSKEVATGTWRAAGGIRFRSEPTAQATAWSP